jgi:hypothetical protein
MIHADHDDIFFAREIRSIVEQPIARTAREAAAGSHTNDRPARFRGRGVDVHLQAVFTHGLSSIQCENFRERSVFILGRAFSNRNSPHTSPRRGFHRRHEAIRARRRPANGTP